MENYYFYFLITLIAKIFRFHGEKNGKRDNSNTVTVFTQNVLLTEK